MQWINRIRQVKILLVVAAIILSVASLVVSNVLVRDLKLEEQRKEYRSYSCVDSP